MASRIAALALFVLLIPCGTFAQSQEARDHKAVTQKQDSTKQEKQTAKQKATPIEKVKPEPVKDAGNNAAKDSDEKLKIDRELAEYTGKLAVYTEKLAVYTQDVSRFTFWLVCATVVLGVVGIAQSYLTWRSVKVGESALTVLERPYLFMDLSAPVFGSEIAVANFTGRFTYTIPRALIPVRYSLYNTGRTAAILTQRRHRIVQTDSDDTLPPVTDPSVADSTDDFFPDGSAVDKTRQFGIEFDNRAMAPGLRGVFLFGFIRYRDIFKKRHITGFCARLNRDTNRFDLQGDDRYNYTRDE